MSVSHSVVGVRRKYKILFAIEHFFQYQRSVLFFFLCFPLISQCIAFLCSWKSSTAIQTKYGHFHCIPPFLSGSACRKRNDKRQQTLLCRMDYHYTLITANINLMSLSIEMRFPFGFLSVFNTNWNDQSNIFKKNAENPKRLVVVRIRIQCSSFWKMLD